MGGLLAFKAMKTLRVHFSYSDALRSEFWQTAGCASAIIGNDSLLIVQQALLPKGGSWRACCRDRRFLDSAHLALPKPRRSQQSAGQGALGQAVPKGEQGATAACGHIEKRKKRKDYAGSETA